MCPGPPWAKERNLIIFWAHKLFRTQWGQDLGPDGTRLRPPVAHEKVCVPHLPCGPMKETLNICVAHNFFRRLWVCDIGGGGMGEICAPRRFPLTQKGNHDYLGTQAFSHPTGWDFGPQKRPPRKPAAW